ncbi:hypothetical protein CDV55_100880 [Aspergillus turcosus]|nr:hypothetical protein CDV55_100880 [Aspergillus turcosus]
MAPQQQEQRKYWTRQQQNKYLSKLRPSSAIRPATAYRWIDASNWPHFVNSLLKYAPSSQEFPDCDESADEDYLPPSIKKQKEDSISPKLVNNATCTATRDTTTASP